MLDLSAAFDTIDHDIMMSRLCNVYGITGDALDWFRSYITGSIQRVEDDVSVDQELGFGVPHGSVLGPKIYCMYTNLLLLLSTHSHDPCWWGESDVPACGPPASFSVHLASSAVTPAGSVHKSGATMWCVCGYS